MKQITRLAFMAPTVLKIGDLFDEKFEQFCNGRSILRTDLPPELIDSLDIPSTEVEIMTSSSLSDRFSALNVQGEMQLSFLTENDKLQGVGKVLGEDKLSVKSDQTIHVYTIKTMLEQLKTSNEKALEEYLNPASLSWTGATHFVSAIEWGANLVVTAERYKESKKNEQVLSGSLDLNYAGCKLKLGDGVNADSKTLAEGAASAQRTTESTALQAVETPGTTSLIRNNKESNSLALHSSSEDSKSGHTYFQLYSSVQMSGNFLRPSNSGGDSVQCYIDELRKSTEGTNRGKGRPLVYHLSPVSVLRPLDSSRPEPLKKIDKNMSTWSTSLFEDKARLAGQIRDMKGKFKTNSSLLPDSIVCHLSIIERNTKLWEDDFRKLLKGFWNQFAAGSATSEEGLSLMTERRTALDELKLGLQDLDTICNEKISIWRSLSALQVERMQKGESEAWIVMCSRGPGNAHIFYLKREKQISPEWEIAMQKLQRILNLEKRRRDGAKFLYVDTDLFPNLTHRPQIGLESYKDGELMPRGWMPPSPWFTFKLSDVMSPSRGSNLFVFGLGSVVVIVIRVIVTRKA